MISTMGLVLSGLAVTWAWGGLLLRTGGAVLALLGVLGLAVAGSPDGSGLLVVGGVLWTAGRAHHRIRHGRAGVR